MDRKSGRYREVSSRHTGWGVTGSPHIPGLLWQQLGRTGCLDVVLACADPDTELPEAVLILPRLKQER